jgi:hypothetical protein
MAGGWIWAHEEAHEDKDSIKAGHRHGIQRNLSFRERTAQYEYS